jgi:hypothetical protein
MAFSKFKLFGLQRTCTNLLLQALRKTYVIESLEDNYEWKHGAIGPVADTGAATVCSVKDPFAWLSSMYRFAHTTPDKDHCPLFDTAWSFAEFLRQPHYTWPNPAQRWNAMNTHYADWVAQHPEQGFLVHSERLMGTGNQERVIREIGDHFGWTGGPVTFQERVFHDGSEAHVRMDFEYYLSKAYLAEYSTEDLQFVRRALDLSLARRLGYGGAI